MEWTTSCMESQNHIIVINFTCFAELLDCYFLGWPIRLFKSSAKHIIQRTFHEFLYHVRKFPSWYIFQNILYWRFSLMRRRFLPSIHPCPKKAVPPFFKILLLFDDWSISSFTVDWSNLGILSCLNSGLNVVVIYKVLRAIIVVSWTISKCAPLFVFILDFYND